MLSSTRSVAMTMLVSVSLLAAPNQDQSSHGMEQPPAVDSLLSLNNEGNRLREQGLCRQAVAVLLRARSAALKELGPANASIATPTNNLALAYLCLKQFASAERHFRDALTLLYDDSLIETRASILNNLGILLIQLSRTKEAEVTLLQALSLNEALHGSRHPKTALAISSLGVLRLQCGQYVQARDLFHRSKCRGTGTERSSRS